MEGCGSLLVLVLCVFVHMLVFFEVSFCQENGESVNKDRWSIFHNYLGRGYDVLFGYPFPNFILKNDPGFKEVIITTNRETVNAIDDFTCNRDDYITVIDGINALTNVISYYVNIEDSETEIKQFSASSPYKLHFENLEMQNRKFAISQNVCLTSYATFNISDSASHLNKDFLHTVDSLPTLTHERVSECPVHLYKAEPDHDKCKYSIQPWVAFFQKYGTHLLVAAHFGGIAVMTFEISNKKAREIKLNNYKYSVKNVPVLNVKNIPDILVDNFRDTKKKETNEQEEVEKASREKNKFGHIEINGGIDLSFANEELTYDAWKANVKDHFVPVHLDLMLLSALMVPEKHKSFNLALTYYNELFGSDKRSLFFSEDIRKFLSNGIQVTGSAVDQLVLTCPENTILVTGFIVTFDTSEEEKKPETSGVGLDSQKTPSRIIVHPCIPEGDDTTSCSYRPIEDIFVSFGWIYCAKEKIDLLQTLHINGEDAELNKPLTLECPESTVLGLGFHIELEKKSDFTNWEFHNCEFGKKVCTSPFKVNNKTDSLMWGFCIADTIKQLYEVTSHFASKQNVDTDVYLECVNDDSVSQNIYLGFTFSFTKDMDQIYVDVCEPSTKKCINKITSLTEKSYVGALVLCDATNQVTDFQFLPKGNH